MKQHYVMPVGVDDFKRVREEYYYVDKTDFIKTMIDGHSQATLITRPRRFGKTLAMSMLYYFFNLRDKEENRHLFEGCAIEKAGDRYMQMQGSKPVIFLSLKDIKERDFPGMLANFGEVMKNLYYDYRFLLDGDTLLPSEKEVYHAILSLNADKTRLQFSLKNLSDYLFRYYKKPVLILIDEYDAPIQYAWDNDYYDDAITFLRNYLSSVLKSNPCLDFAVITGVLRIAKESIFSSLNNLKVSSVSTGGFADVAGFSEAEMKRIASDLGCPDKFEEIKNWYDGYNFSGKEIYNPWSVISYFENERTPGAYWVNTSGNTILRHMLKHATPRQTKELVSLLHGGKIRTSLDESIIYNEIYKNSDALYSMLLTTGYLTMVDYPDYTEDDFRCTMRIPNREIRVLFKREVMSHLKSLGPDSQLLGDLIDSLLSGDTETFNESLNTFLMLMASFYDTANRESFYHGLVLGLLATLIPRYEVASNRESGYGRFDIAIFPVKGQKVGVILEFKVAEHESDMESKAREALAQIEEKNYLAEFHQRNIPTIWQYGISFCGKKCHIMEKTNASLVFP